MSRTVIVSIAALCCACGASRERFEPAERATARTAEGYTAAEYEIQGREGVLGDAKLWTRGAFRAEVRGQKRTVVHVGFELENNSNQPFELVRDQIYLDSATLDRAVVRDIPPTQVNGSTTVPPGATRRVDAFFSLPPGAMPHDADAFRVHWKIANGSVSYAQRTPFLETPDRQVPYYYYTPFYDPFYYDPYIFSPRVIVHRYPYRHRHIYR
jgi:hypothetical protein